MKISEFQTAFFTDGSAPSRNTIKQWFRDGTVNGKKLGKLYYVIIDEKIDQFFEAPPESQVVVSREEQLRLDGYSPAVIEIIMTKMKW
ncbi:hypothetical protein [Alcanivorax sp.]|jgi:hypothetical protein|uniref:hypothetical protein n=1 Tax=Alcanivorax sp. TaxID=1872427 RepID=UPI0032D91834